MEMQMKNKIKVILAPADWQVQLVLDTLEMYSDMCNYISRVVHKRDCRKPKSLYYWVVDHHQNFYKTVRHEFPDINTNLIPLAFRKIAKAYKKKRPDEPLKFQDTLDCSNYTISIKFVLPSPNNIGMLTISTLAGRLAMHFIFDDAQRKELNVAFNHKRFRDYQLIFQNNQFNLITDVYDQKNDSNVVDSQKITKATINKLIKQQSTNTNNTW